MKKRILKASLSALGITLMGLVLAFVGKPAIFADAITNVGGLFPELWYIILPSSVAFLLVIVDIVLKARRRDRNPVVPLSMIVSLLALLLIAPIAYPEFVDFTSVPKSGLVFTTGAALIALAFLVLFVLSFIDLFLKGVPRVKEEELAEEDYETVGEDDEITALGPVEYLDEEVEDEEDLEEETEADRKATRNPKKKEKKDDFDRIYHVMKRAKDDRWIVKIAQSRKAIKIFDTQKEAIAYAEVLAGNNKGVVRVFASKGANKGRIIV